MTTNLQNAINKARRIKCAVKVLAGRVYLVITPRTTSTNLAKLEGRLTR